MFCFRRLRLPAVVPDEPTINQRPRLVVEEWPVEQINPVECSLSSTGFWGDFGAISASVLQYVAETKKAHGVRVRVVVVADEADKSTRTVTQGAAGLMP